MTNRTQEDKVNPYSPTDTVLETQGYRQRVIHSPLVLSIQWTVILLCNSIVPLLIGWSGVGGVDGQIGIVLGLAVGLLVGYLASLYTPMMVMYAVRGGLMVALSQVFPILQLLAGMLAIESMRKTGLIPAERLDVSGLGVVDSFLVTLATGLMLVCIACFFGLLLRQVTPNRWWIAKVPAEE